MKRPADFKAKPRMNWGTTPRILDYASKLISHYDTLVQYAIESRDAWRACKGCGPAEILDEARKSRDRAAAFAQRIEGFAEALEILESTVRITKLYGDFPAFSASDNQ